MILTVDIGNTTVGICGINRRASGERTVEFSFKLDTVHGKGIAEYLSELSAKLEKAGAGVFEGAVISSVVPCMNGTINSCVRSVTGCEPVWIRPDSRTGLTMDVPEPDKVGLDRIVDSAFAAEHFPLPVVTVDVGTATTFNVIDEGRIFRGGIISPGLATGLQALVSRTAQLPEISLSKPEYVIGKNTKECMLSGSVAGTAAMIDGLTARIEKELERPVTLVITGGLSRHVESLCTHPHICDPHLLAKGLALLYDWNR